jgi:ribosome assembly protein YihI (activator of Der GTPase)
MLNKRRQRREKKREQLKRGAKSDEKNDAKNGGKRSEKAPPRQSCTQRCPRGLLTKDALDNDCPNVEEYRGKVRGQDRHVISPPTFLRLMRSQLARDRDSNCEPLYIQGGTWCSLQADSGLPWIYGCCQGHHLRLHSRPPARGDSFTNDSAPFKACASRTALGPSTWCFPTITMAARLSTCCFSAGVESVSIATLIATIWVTFWTGASRALQAIHQLEVLHHDAMPRNLLWNTEGERVMVVDFEWAKVVERKATKKRKTAKLGRETEVFHEKDTLYARETRDVRVGLARVCVRFP